MENGDKFILSKGHAAPAQYVALAKKGFFDKSELKNLRQLGSILQGHPDELLKKHGLTTDNIVKTVKSVLI